jgi:hypothetical protein
MTRASRVASLFLFAAAPAFWGCSDDGQPAVDMSSPGFEAGVDMNSWDHSPGADHSPVPDQQPADAGPPDAPPLQVINETEPNNGGTKTEYNSITPPIQIKGAIGTAEDSDIFGFTASAGARYSVTVKGDGALQPHVVIFDLDNKLPVAASNGATEALAEYYVLKAVNPLLIVVRDRRNLPASSSQKVGGPTFTYTVTVTPLTRAPVQVSLGSQQTSTLAPQGTVRVFAFTAAKDADLDLEALVTAPADVDARLSLFHVGNKSWHGTNETPSQLDAKLLGKMPISGTYHAIVENVADYPTKLDFVFKITKK